MNNVFSSNPLFGFNHFCFSVIKVCKERESRREGREKRWRKRAKGGLEYHCNVVPLRVHQVRSQRTCHFGMTSVHRCWVYSSLSLRAVSEWWSVRLQVPISSCRSSSLSWPCVARYRYRYRCPSTLLFRYMFHSFPGHPSLASFSMRFFLYRRCWVSYMQRCARFDLVYGL